jgi:quinolinate synthase
MCKNMKMTTLEDLFLSLEEERHAVTLPSKIAAKVQVALSRMFELCGEGE